MTTTLRDGYSVNPEGYTNMALLMDARGKTMCDITVEYSKHNTAIIERAQLKKIDDSIYNIDIKIVEGKPFFVAWVTTVQTTTFVGGNIKLMMERLWIEDAYDFELDNGIKVTLRFYKEDKKK